VRCIEPSTLPAGAWFDFWTGREYAGKQPINLNVPLERIPIFVKGGCLIPLAEPTLHTEDSASWLLQIQKYGGGTSSTTLYEDDGSFEPQLIQIEIAWDGSSNAGTLRNVTNKANPRYNVNKWTLVPDGGNEVSTPGN
jgi:alpha-D-xyloside xylohydrolase